MCIREIVLARLCGGRARFLPNMLTEPSWWLVAAVLAIGASGCGRHGEEGAATADVGAAASQQVDSPRTAGEAVHEAAAAYAVRIFERAGVRPGASGADDRRASSSPCRSCATWWATEPRSS